MIGGPADFIRTNTALGAPPLVPEIRLHLATEITPIWHATERELAAINLPPPYWAFCWPGGQALARHLLNHPELVRGKRVLDFASGCGIGAIAAAMSGAAHVEANDIDAFALAAIDLNARANGVAVTIVGEDLVGEPNRGWDVVIAGDICYEQPMAERVAAWLRRLATDGTLVLMGDPGRTYLPGSGLAEVARYKVPTSLELEDRTEREGVIWRVLP